MSNYNSNFLNILIYLESKLVSNLVVVNVYIVKTTRLFVLLRSRADGHSTVSNSPADVVEVTDVSAPAVPQVQVAAEGIM